MLFGRLGRRPMHPAPFFTSPGDALAVGDAVASVDTRFILHLIRCRNHRKSRFAPGLHAPFQSRGVETLVPVNFCPTGR